MPIAARETTIIHDLSPPEGTPELELVMKYPEVWDMVVGISAPEREEIILATSKAQTQAEAIRLAQLGIGVLNSVEARFRNVTHMEWSRLNHAQRSRKAAG